MMAVLSVYHRFNLFVIVLYCNASIDERMVVRISWEFSAQTIAGLEAAADRWDNLVDANQSVGLDFHHFGKEEMKTWQQVPVYGRSRAECMNEYACKDAHTH